MVCDGCPARGLFSTVDFPKDISRQELESGGIGDGTIEREFSTKVQFKPGMWCLSLRGTVHAIGAGI